MHFKYVNACGHHLTQREQEQDNEHGHAKLSDIEMLLSIILLYLEQ